MFKYNPQAQPIAKEAKIVKLNKINNGSNSNYQRQLQSELDVSNISFISANDVQHLPELNSTLIYSSVNSSFQSNSFDTTKSYSDSDDNDVTGEYLTKVYIIKDHKGQLNYGDMSVKRGEYVYLISESVTHCFVENSKGEQGFIPKDTCIDLEETVRNAKQRFNSNNFKITSL